MADTKASELQDRTREVSARKVIVSEFVTLDGVMEDPSWTAPFTGQEQEQYKFDELSAADALLLGRTTYEEFAAAWPSMMEQYEGPRRAELGKYADMMNAYPKHVVSTTLEEPLEWNNSTLMEGDVAEAVTRLKQQSGKDILVFGSGERRYPHRLRPAGRWTAGRGGARAALRPGFDPPDCRGAGKAFHRDQLRPPGQGRQR